ncbi:caspase family protein [Runella sp. MFBS21]|uniref:caspase family protein n=1 Tax=Runella sp. MFBS21 TaxID=3034018 RepID=UPI0023F8DFE2|nr:caspase family protein [Runella sp. MFBS21]MDF7821841.1 caspase family protein [Runella sp. MFBS21]
MRNKSHFLCFLGYIIHCISLTVNAQVSDAEEITALIGNAKEKVTERMGLPERQVAYSSTKMLYEFYRVGLSVQSSIEDSRITKVFFHSGVEPSSYFKKYTNKLPLNLNFNLKSIQVIDMLGNPTEKQNDGKGYVYYYYDNIGVDFIFMNSSDRMVSVAFRKNPTPNYISTSNEQPTIVSNKKQEQENEAIPKKSQAKTEQVLLKERVALIIGNSTYEHGSRLESRPINDAKDISERLKQLGFNVTTLTDATKGQIEKTLGDFSKKAKDADVALFFYAGHGIESEGVNYLLPIDATLESREDARLQAVSLDLILSEMKRYNTKVNLVYLDACRNNPFRSWNRDVGSRGFVQVGRLSQSTKVYYATQPGDVANNGNGRNGVFTGSLLKHLKKGAEIEELMREVTIDVIKTTSNNQQPYSAGTLLTKFEF